MEVIQKIPAWLAENWIVVALVVSEIAAFLPAKAKGIAHFLLKIGQAIFKPESTKIKNFKK